MNQLTNSTGTREYPESYYAVTAISVAVSKIATKTCGPDMPISEPLYLSIQTMQFSVNCWSFALMAVIGISFRWCHKHFQFFNVASGTPRTFLNIKKWSDSSPKVPKKILLEISSLNTFASVFQKQHWLVHQKCEHDLVVTGHLIFIFKTALIQGNWCTVLTLFLGATHLLELQ